MKKETKKIEDFLRLSLKKINRNHLGLKSNINLFEQNLDSLDFLKLIFVLEKKYKIQIKSKDFNKLKTIQKLVKHVEKKI
jgi:acyl carrier protein|tara:strand:- start:473 stop:712 length:240 start_codon:yes stop_codon:yes gene_type:complete